MNEMCYHVNYSEINAKFRKVPRNDGLIIIAWWKMVVHFFAINFIVILPLCSTGSCRKNSPFDGTKATGNAKLRENGLKISAQKQELIQRIIWAIIITTHGIYTIIIRGFDQVHQNNEASFLVINQIRPRRIMMHAKILRNIQEFHKENMYHWLFKSIGCRNFFEDGNFT